MARFLGGVCCAVVTLWGVVVLAQANVEGEADDPFGKLEQNKEQVSPEERIKAVLNSQLKSPLDFAETPLNDVINFLAEEYEIPIVFDNAALDEVAISPETPVSINMRHISLRAALDLMLKQPGIEDLTFIVDKEVLLVTTQERADATLLVRLYRIDDLEMFADPPREEAQGWADFTPLVRAITSCVEPDSWKQRETGNGDIMLIRPGVLVVVQSQRVHKQIDELLSQLRDLKVNFGNNPENAPNRATAALAD